MSGQDTISQGSISREAAESIILREADNLAHLADIGFEVSVELGRKRMHLSQFEALEAQDTIDLNKLAGEAFDIRVNGHLFGEGEILVMTDTIACRVTSMHVPSPSRPAGLLREVIGEPSLEQAEYEEVESVKDMIFIPAG